jgi:hypothetical protein
MPVLVAHHLRRASAKYADGDPADELVRTSPMAGEQIGDRTAGAPRLGSLRCSYALGCLLARAPEAIQFCLITLITTAEAFSA